MEKIIYLVSFIFLTILISCEKESESLLNDTKVDFNGEWKVNAYNDSSFVFGPFKIVTLGNETGGDSITVKDSEIKFWKFQVKANANDQNGTFETDLSNCEVSEVSIGVKINNGKILNTDSIYFEIQFEDDETPYGNVYILKGARI